jgi:hypothetical protein
VSLARADTETAEEETGAWLVIVYDLQALHEAALRLVTASLKYFFSDGKNNGSARFLHLSTAAQPLAVPQSQHCHGHPS